MRDHSQHIQLSREEAVAATLAALDAQPEGFGWRGRAAAADHAGKVERKLVERVSLSESVGRVLAFNKDDRHIRGGDATRRKYLMQRLARTEKDQTPHI